MSNRPTTGSEPKKEEKPPIARKRTILISLLIIELALASTIATLGIRRFLTWYHTTGPKKRQNDVLFYTILLIATCAPTCVFIGMLVAAAHYYTRKKEWGEYKVNMRSQGRGFIMDPSDAEDRKKEDEAKMTNAKKAKEENEKREEERTTTRSSEQPRLALVPASERMSMVASWVLGAGVSTVSQPEPSHTTSKYSSVNPYGWLPKLEEPEGPQEFVGRSDSWKAYKNSPMAKKGVDNIWLIGCENKASDGKGKVKSSWDDDVEMGVVRKPTM